MSSWGTYFLLSVLKLILLHCMKRASFSLCRVSETALITSYLMHHHFVRSTALPSAASPFQLTDTGQHYMMMTFTMRKPFPHWLLLCTQQRRSWIWGQVMHSLPEGRRRAGENPLLPWLDQAGTRVLSLLSVPGLLCAKTSCVFHCCQSGISCQL